MEVTGEDSVRESACLTPSSGHALTEDWSAGIDFEQGDNI